MSLQVPIPPSVNGIITHCISPLCTSSPDSAITVWKKCVGKLYNPWTSQVPVCSPISGSVYAGDRLSLITFHPSARHWSPTMGTIPLKESSFQCESSKSAWCTLPPSCGDASFEFFDLMHDMHTCWIFSFLCLGESWCGDSYFLCWMLMLLISRSAMCYKETGSGAPEVFPSLSSMTWGYYPLWFLFHFLTWCRSIWGKHCISMMTRCSDDCWDPIFGQANECC